MSKKNGIYAQLESLDDFKAQIQKQIVSSFSRPEAEKWAKLRDATRSLATLSRSSTAEEVFQILDKVSPLLRTDEFPDEYEPQVLQVAWRVSRNLHEQNVAALPIDEFESLPTRLRLIFDNAIIAVSPQERSVKVRRACDLADLFYSGEKQDSPSADECLAALREAVGDATADDLTSADKERIKKHFGLDLRTRSEFPVNLFREKDLNQTGVKAPVKTGPRESRE